MVQWIGVTLPEAHAFAPADKVQRYFENRGIEFEEGVIVEVDGRSVRLGLADYIDPSEVEVMTPGYVEELSPREELERDIIAAAREQIQAIKQKPRAQWTDNDIFKLATALKIRDLSE